MDLQGTGMAGSEILTKQTKSLFYSFLMNDMHEKSVLHNHLAPVKSLIITNKIL